MATRRRTSPPNDAPAAPLRGERVQKLLAAAGLGSRRQIEQWIRDGRVQMGGVVIALGARALPGAEIRLDGQPLQLAPYDPAPHPAGREREVLLYHKPTGEVTTRSDPQGRPTVFDRLPPPRAGGRWVVIGRLDVNTTGLLLFTTDGALAHRWMHPSGQIEREYLVRVRGTPTAADLARLRQGIVLEDGPAHFKRIEPTQQPHGASGPDAAASGHSWVLVTLEEGRNREVRRLWLAAGYEVSRLKRIRFGPVALPADLAPGRWRWLPHTSAGRL